MKSLRFSLLVTLSVSVLSFSEGSGSLSQQPLEGVDGLEVHRPYTFIFELRKDGNFIRHCGGAQINSSWFLTAAECVDRRKYDIIRMVTMDSNQTVIGVSIIWMKYRIHPEYNEETKENNIALMKGVPAKTLRADDLPRLSSNSKGRSNDPAVVFGWTNWPTTQTVTMTSMNTVEIHPLWCKLLYPLRFKMNQHLCVSGVKGKGLSPSDVGAPLVVTHSEKVTELVGIATDIRPFTNAVKMPMVFTKLSPYMEWILRETDKASEE